ncbi:gamma-butyrobetaine hydroxylase [Thalassobaculum fulvum]|uniref:Gamma-butyrobetaine hydroxylase n=1 Tax=Thalassobaculum fulvum TaxID=1633335 RepID=A0A919CQZ0_9PROT|nr:TauD/TfdA family dioxygenase [Thalassobaculum fulvum]GHD50865.1 gamma-butyrobetaine hydroxylase [Thalassobaculum fulvum]
MTEAPPLTPDFDVWPVGRRPVSATVAGSDVVVTWEDGIASRFDFWWLIDNSPMPEHVNRTTREPTLDLSALPDDFHATAATVEAGGGLYVTWSHGVSASRYHPGWLAAHAYDAPAGGGFDADDRPRPVTWDAAAMAEPPSFDGSRILEDDAALEAWLTAVAVYGFGRLRGVPVEPGTVERVARRIGTVRETNFGRVFDVRSKVDPDSNAYTALELTPHVDLPTREYQPGLQILHCLENSASGGEAMMVDGFRLAEHLAAEEPGTYRILSTERFTFQNRAKTSDYRWLSPVIVLDPATGSPTEVRIAGFLRGPLALPAERVAPAYRALRRVFALSRDPRFRIAYGYRPGDLVLFDNRRLLHGRAAFDPAAGARWLQGIYLERDELHSCLRILRRRRRLAAGTD